MDVEKRFRQSLRTDSLQQEADNAYMDEGEQLQYMDQDETRQENITYISLFKSIDRGDFDAMKEFLNKNHEALTSKTMSNGDTPLHKAVLSGHIKIVEEIVRQIHDPNFLETKNDSEMTPLTYAATGGIVRIAECLVTKCSDLVSIGNKKGHIPVVVASLYGHRDLVRYLYSVTPLRDLDPSDESDENKGKNGAMLVTNCIVDGLYDIALDLIQRYPKLVYIRDFDNDTAILALAQTPSAFPSSTNLRAWQWWIYSCIHIHKPHEVPNYHKRTRTRGDHTFRDKVLNSLKFLFPHINQIYKLKLGHIQAKDILEKICREIAILDSRQHENACLNQALFKAVENGIVEYVEELMKHWPDIVWFRDKFKLNVFLCAVRQRQEKIFSLIYKMGGKKNILATAWDRNNNNMLHQAAFKAPSSRLNPIPGAALQMQRELQWFKEVESLVQPKHRKMLNSIQKKTPRALFTDQHKELVEQGEKWMKETASSCSVVAALIATMMFSAAFTVPGGYSEGGTPIYIRRKSFMVYIVSDAISLFTSCVSLLMFLGILKSRYREEDFLRSLPTKLIVGLASLFLSMASMMVTFVVTLTMTILVGDNVLSWVSAPFIFLAVISVGIFVVLQFPVLVEIFCSTYGRGVFDKPRS
ncbi:PREDICTED: ankyrin repeat-containing protein ITN1 [Tarenaya hassleriana]|uniref:ankyrin repeat-containing protein ITN1 n=1 Tax=Tarenaya hassleriana TaxID=28532 RepID=UPI00053C9D90|nr:PREDICTED: ankyrin repeat-containing protein ITN1 [Tarenaya hassleriana]